MIRLVFLSLLLASVMGLDPKVLNYPDDPDPKSVEVEEPIDVEEPLTVEEPVELEELDDEEALRPEIRGFERHSLKPSVGKSYPTDCADLKRAGVTKSGVYNIYPYSCSCIKPVKVYCDMETDGGGWTLLLMRRNQGLLGQLNFNQTWDVYKSGFGEADKEYWIGNDNIYQMTRTRNYALRLDMTHTTGSKDSLVYSSFKIGAEVPDRYRLSLGNYISSESTLGSNCFNYANSRYFSTYDKDNDNYSGKNCATNGAFWYYNCQSYGIRSSPTSNYNNYMNLTCYHNSYKVTDLSMKIRPAACEDTRKVAHAGGCSQQCF